MKKIILSLFLIFFLKVVQAQNVTILPSGITPVQASHLKLTYDQIQAKTDMAIGDLVFDLTFYCVRIYNGHEWVRILNAQSTEGDVTAFGCNAQFTTIIGVAHDSQNNIYIAGLFRASIILSPTVTLTGGAEYESLFIAKYNTSGTLLSYTKEQATNVSVIPTDLHIDSNDNVYVSGSYYGTVAFGGIYNYTPLGDNDAFIAKYNTSLAIQWVKSEGGTGPDIAQKVVTDASGNVFVAGTYQSTINFNGGAIQKTSNGWSDIFVAKYTSAGLITWVNSVGGVNYDYLKDIYHNGSNALYIAGTYYDATTIGTENYTSNGMADLFMAKFDINGVYQSSFSVGGTEEDGVFLSIVKDSQGTLFLAGDFQGTITVNGSDYVSKGSVDIFLATILDQIGPSMNARQINWMLSIDSDSFNTFGGTNVEYVTDAISDANGNIYLTGYTNVNLSIEGYSIAEPYGTFVWRRNTENLTTALFSFPSALDSRITKDNLGNVFISSVTTSPVTIGGAYINTPSATMSAILARMRLN
ncbi:hypothetical protein EMA8858_01836 [Emticicia aquatica]|uniref:Beta-propeller repeat-containing protein n=1 Tax=Emticicia aquatica TaxID=1681835 RepID=A0ABN8EUV0_9BACT|nr:hypothetical protein [Emticicia aquatica]CAH0995711.1 hypothetical protein EMA8858_01836 [Emticicia aquatica]